MRENAYRFTFLLLAVWAMVLASCQAVRSQELPKVEETVEVKGKLESAPIISIEVTPRVAIQDPRRRTWFRVLVRIKGDDRNQLWSFSADCGGNATASIRKVEAALYERREEMLVLQDCIFQACVHRVEKKQAKAHCARQEARVQEQPP